MSEIIQTVGVAAFKDDSILLVRHTEKANHIKDTYGLPAGRLEDGEDFVAAAVREFAEETGLTCLTNELVELPEKYQADIPRSDGTVKRFALTVLLCKKWSGELRVSEENIPEWVKIQEISNYQLLPNTDNAIAQAQYYRS